MALRPEPIYKNNLLYAMFFSETAPCFNSFMVFRER